MIKRLFKKGLEIALVLGWLFYVTMIFTYDFGTIKHLHAVVNMWGITLLFGLIQVVKILGLKRNK